MYLWHQLWSPSTKQILDNTNWRPSGLEGRVSNEKRELLVGCTEDRRAGRRAAQKGGPAGYRKRRNGLQKRAALPFSQPSLMCSPLARPVVQLAISLKIHVFYLATRPSSPPILRLVLSQIIAIIWAFGIAAHHKTVSFCPILLVKSHQY